MRSVYCRGLMLLLGLCAPAVAIAQEPANCPVPGGPSTAWSTPIERTAGGNALAPADIPVGQALRLALLAQGNVKFALPPGKAGAENSYAGLLRLTIATSGTYRITLGTGAWIDLVDQGQALAATAHAHGPPCSGIHKMVDFALHPGSYILQISANAEPQTTVLVMHAP